MNSGAAKNTLEEAASIGYLHDMQSRVDKDAFEEMLAGAPSSIRAFLTLRLWRRAERSIVWIVGGQGEMETLCSDLETLSAGEVDVLAFNPSGQRRAERALPESGDAGGRLETLIAVDGLESPAVVVSCVHALMQPTISRDDLRRNSLRLRVGDELDSESLAAQLLGLGYDFTTEVQQPGEASLRGGIFDLWPPGSEWPLRIELFGDEVDSLRRFDPDTQISVERCGSVGLFPACDRPLKSPSSLIEHLPEAACLLCPVSSELQAHAELLRENSEEELLGWSDIEAAIGERLVSAYDRIVDPETFPDDMRPVERIALPADGALDPDLLGERRRRYLRELERLARAGDEVRLYFYTAGVGERFRELYGDSLDFDLFQIHQGHLSHGFRSDSLRLHIVAESELCGYSRDFARQRRRRLRRQDRRRELERVQAWTELQPGDLVVHIDNGVGRYLGLYEIRDGAATREVLALEYAGGSKLYVPSDHAHLLSRYIGLGRHAPELHKLGGAKWTRDKHSARRAVEDLAAAMLETQAERELEQGFAFASDDLLQREFENSFPYEETPDQSAAIEAVKSDMRSPQPMDRLICGDVGYGKTEVAMRAAFKAVRSGRQVALLVPTTVLAQQHYETFSERMEAFPVRIEMLSRFRSKRQQLRTLERMRAGMVDIVIGTHRLVQPDVVFRSLGLVIIDEEQRFGVKQKESLKQLRRTIDVLTMTATPIPRTLYMSLAGAKDMSTIQTAPRERIAVETIVESFSENIVRSAVLREVERGGQVFMLHNRVKTIDSLRRRIAAVLPEEIRIAVAHGRMGERGLADVMHRFGAGEIDLLICTTIIESGVDIPNVNTILIDRADRFGLADLYQLRGRVGRQDRKAYAYLLLPRGGGLFDTARQRIRALQRYSGLGDGFNLALRDLEIRGAGNLLGREQSGHIAAIGFDLYCQLLKRTVARLKGEELSEVIDVDLRIDFITASPGDDSADAAAMLPYSFIEDEDMRLKFYRDLAGCGNREDLREQHARIRDQYGRIPAPVEMLFSLAGIRISAAAAGIDRVEVGSGRLMLRKGAGYIQEGGRFPRIEADNPAAKLKQIDDMIGQVCA